MCVKVGEGVKVRICVKVGEGVKVRVCVGMCGWVWRCVKVRV